MKKFWPFILILVIALIAVGLFLLPGISSSGGGTSQPSSSSGNTESDDDFSDIDNGVIYDEELEGAELTFKNAKAEDFYGRWTADSGQSVYMYGNVDLDIQEDGSWAGNIAEENFSGKWKFSGNSMTLTSEAFNVKLSFATNGKLIMQEDRDGSKEYINTVLVRKK